jgi:hypothetical protein
MRGAVAGAWWEWERETIGQGRETGEAGKNGRDDGADQLHYCLLSLARAS